MHKDIVVKKNQELILPVLWTGKETELSYNIKLAGNGAQLKLLILLLGKDYNKIDLKTNIYHQNLNTKSRIIVKGAINDNANINYDGLVKIEHGAKGTDAHLAANFLLLSERAKGRAVPSLEILENDIKAGHATTVGRISDLELFYLMSRGLSGETAKKLIVQGFLNSMIGDFPEKMAKQVQKELEYV